MVTDPAHRRMLEDELVEIRKGIEELTAAEVYVMRRLGLDTKDAGGDSATVMLKLTPGDGAAGMINPGQFYGMSVTKASAAVLEMVGRNQPLTSRELFDAITKGGATPKTVEVVGKMLKRSPRFHQLGQGRGARWGLAEWYSRSVRARTADGGSEDDDSGSGEGGNPQETADSIGVQT